MKTAKQLAAALKVPVAFLYCDDDVLASILLLAHRMPREARRALFWPRCNEPFANEITAPPQASKVSTSAATWQAGLIRCYEAFVVRPCGCRAGAMHPLARAADKAPMTSLSRPAIILPGGLFVQHRASGVRQSILDKHTVVI